MIVDMLGDLQHSLHAIRATLGSGAGDQFGDLPASPAANGNSPAAPKPAAVEARMFKAKVIEAKVVGADIAAFTADLVAKGKPPASRADAGDAAPAGAETPAASLPPALETERCHDDQPAAANPAATPSPRLSHLLMAAELDRLLDAQAATETGTNDPPAPEPAAAAPVEATPPVAEIPPGEVTATIEAAAPVESTAPVEAAPSETIEVEPAEPEAPTMPAAPPPRRVAAIAKDLFADVMALSEEERIALFT
jgi:hypothetical protein